MKQFRKTIRLNGKEVKSPRFSRASDAERWYQTKLREKQFTQEGLHLPINDRVILNDYVHLIWLPKRKATYPKSTWYSDEQRYRDYVETNIGRLRVSRINQLQVRSTLKNVVEKHGHSIQTRNRVRALLSKIFNDSMNEDKPLRTDNPALNISFKDPRQGKKAPEFIKREQDITKFMRAAKELSSTHYAYAAIMLMAGPRKSEAIPLKWEDFDSEESELSLNKRFMQAANEIVSGLKSGSEDSRIVGIPDSLVRILNSHRRQSDYQADTDFILSRPDGSNFNPRDLHTLHMEIVKASGIEVTPHGLRHTFGREWAKRGGNMKALQSVLGHSNSAVTDLYSTLAGKQIKKDRNTVSFEVDDE